ncbi:MAG: hypothetical protein M1816_007269 [Peltula sp. TS41687]|nr:MAG: hypothetical protein M1816_007269 [Peltula sp. TS41687]
MDDPGGRSPKENDHDRDMKPATSILRPKEIQRIMTDEGTRLLHNNHNNNHHHPRHHEDWDREPAHEGPCNHGTFSPRPTFHKDRGSNASAEAARTFGDSFDGNVNGHTTGLVQRLLGDAAREGSVNSSDGAGTTRWPVIRQDIKHQKSIWSWFRGDLAAALTMASFYLPMSLSYASNLGEIPPINGLYAFIFNPLVYAFLGSSSRMVVGPEAAGSLLLGTIVRSGVDSGQFSDDDDINHARVAGVVTGLAGGMILIAGLARLGFLDNVLSRPFLRGFISAIGVVILVDQLIPEMGLKQRAREVGGVHHGSTLQKLGFLVMNVQYSHRLTWVVSLSAFVVIMVCRELKKRLQPRYPNIAYIPDRFVVVVLSAVLTWRFRWDKQGLSILGDVKAGTGSSFPFHWPLKTSHMDFIRQALSTSFLIATLGFFESSVAAKSLAGFESRSDGLQGMSLSANRELVALGVANLVGGCFMALPAFGGYGRSKVNASTGGKTPMSSILLSLITVLCVLYLLPYFHYLPRAVLSAMISVVAWSLIEEAPHEILFFYRLGGWSELILMFLIFTATILYSLSLGIAIGVGLSLIMVIRHSTRSRIQILGRIPGTREFENAEEHPEAVEFIEGCLIVKIPEPLTFANTGDLKNRLKRLERHGATAVHPGSPQVRSSENNRNIIFDVHGVTSIDGSGVQELAEIVTAYRDRGVRVFFCRVPSERSMVFQRFKKSGIVDNCGGMKYFVPSVDQALRMSELESLSE